MLDEYAQDCWDFAVGDMRDLERHREMSEGVHPHKPYTCEACGRGIENDEDCDECGHVTPKAM